MIIFPNQINFSKYKRIFALGCSFTSYIWPTWADILYKELDSAKYYNLARAGAGNLLIHCTMVEADQRYKFDEGDLVCVMWTTFCREDRYKKNSWIHPGNIFTQGTYSEEWVKKWADPRGYLIRDIALISSAYKYLEFSKCDAVSMLSVPFNYQVDNESHDIIKIYYSTIKDFLGSMLEIEMDNKWTNGHQYQKDGELFYDYHPSPLRYSNYLLKLGFPLSTKTIDYARISTEHLIKTENYKEITNLFHYLQGYKHKPDDLF